MRQLTDMVSFLGGTIWGMAYLIAVVLSLAYVHGLLGKKVYNWCLRRGMKLPLWIARLLL